MKKEVQITQLTLASLLSAALLLTGGCGGGGGGSGDSGSGTANREPDPVTIATLQTGLPVCSSDSQGSLNGATTAGTSASVTVSPSCSDPAATMCVWLGANSADTNITYYDWEIVGWNNQPPHGTFDKYDQIMDVDPVNGRYIVRTFGVNSIRYVSAATAGLASLTEAFTEQITVTAWTDDGRFATANFTVNITPNGTATTSAYGTLAASDASSHSRAGNYSDYYRVTGSGLTTLTAVGFDTYIYLYDDSLTRVAEADEGATGGGSSLSVNLQSGKTYYLEVTSFGANETGVYQLTTSQGGLVATADPWAGSPAPADIAGNYTVHENTTLSILYKGTTTTTNGTAVSTVTVSQSGPAFRYTATDPTGRMPAMTRYGSINGDTLSLSGEPFLPVNPGLMVTANNQTSSGTLGQNQFTITTTSQLQGTYKGQPVTAQVNSTATFTRQ